MDPFRPKVSIYCDRYLSVSNATDSIAFANSDDWTAASSDAELIVMPHLPLASTQDLTQVTWLKAQLQAHGYPTAWVTVGQTVRWHLYRMARYVEPTFELEWFKSI